jgi:hypothetical protein
MTFTIIELRADRTATYTEDIEALDDLFTMGHDRFGDATMTINWQDMTITVKFC